ncbi:MAG: hypothetical protein J0H08_15190 [Rhizobiales bacterium]|nr:hypothetical protein [Hyphomicrobiales bacterium]
MYRKYALVTGFSVGLGLGGSAFADDVPDQVRAIPGNVEDVSIGGNWQDGDRSGAYRIVVTRDGIDQIKARLFVQWIAYGDMGQATVADSIEIKELGELGVDIVNLSSETDEQGISVFVDTMNGGGEVGETYEVHVFSPNDYMFGPASN